MKNLFISLLFLSLSNSFISTQVLAQAVLPPTASPEMLEDRQEAISTNDSLLFAPESENSAKLSRRDSLIQFARQHLNKPYAWGGTGPNAFDCAGFACFVFSKFGIKLARMSEGQKNQCQLVSAAEALPGDLVFYGYPNGRGGYVYTHTAIVYENTGAGKALSVIHSMYYGVKITTLHFDPSWRTRFICIGRII